ncbi:S9 family peptidase [Achromobacter spanius]|uniref:S9 family peptidase n=1 Tax=Achromobacter spanius TaxID=217203 RepID=UPI0037FBA98D
MPTPFCAEDLRLYRAISSLDCAPDDGMGVCAVQSIDAGSGDVLTNLWLVPTDGAAPQQFTQGDADDSPRWSPDGASIAFLATRGASRQVYLIARSGGEARQITSLATGVTSADWMPDGKRMLICTSMIIDPEHPDADPPEDADHPADAPRVATRLPFKLDGPGEKTNTALHLHVLDMQSGNTTQLTHGFFDVTSAEASPDGQYIAYTRTREGRLAHRSDLWVVAADGSGARQLSRDLASVQSPRWSRDGKSIVVTGSDVDGDAQMRLWLVAVADAVVEPLGSDAIEIVLGSSVRWLPDTPAIVAVVARSGRQHLARISVPGGDVTPLVTGDRHISMAAVSRQGLLYVDQDARSPQEVCCADLQGNEQKKLTQFNAWWNDRLLPDVQVGRFDVPDGNGGREQIDGWLLRPAGQKGPTPVLVDLHGGPASYVLLDFRSHVYWYVLLGLGWSILAVNAAGSSSYGREFSARVLGRWGECDLDQHLAAVDALRSDGLADERVAVTGKSYGGYLAAWAVCTTSAFKAAVVSAPVTSLEHHFGTSDSGYYSDAYSMGGAPWERRDLMHRLSPLERVEGVRTPTLILQGDADNRCPKSQAEAFFTGIMAGTQTPARLVLYPNGDHHFFENGKTDHRIDAVQRCVDWLERWAKA